jgi:zinc transporter ZupT
MAMLTASWIVPPVAPGLLDWRSGEIAVLATLLIGTGTLAGIAIVRRVPPGSLPTVALTAAVVVLFAVGDMLPRAYSAATGAGVAPWHVAAAVGAGALMAFCSGATCCGRSGAFPGTVGLMVLGLHRFMEGSAVALFLSVSVVALIFVHALSEGLAAGPMLPAGGRRLVGWLAVLTVAPALGGSVHVGVALRESVAPLALAFVGGWMLAIAWRSIPGSVRAVTEMIRATPPLRGQRSAARSAGS